MESLLLQAMKDHYAAVAIFLEENAPKHKVWIQWSQQNKIWELRIRLLSGGDVVFLYSSADFDECLQWALEARSKFDIIEKAINLGRSIRVKIGRGKLCQSIP